MMLRPSMNDLATRGESYYSVVVGIAKRAREISEEMLEKNKSEFTRLSETKQPSGEKPVRVAVDEYAARKFNIIEDPSLKTGV